MNDAADGPKCGKCGGKTVAVIDPADFSVQRRCVECEVQVVQKELPDGQLSPSIAVPRG